MTSFMLVVIVLMLVSCISSIAAIISVGNYKDILKHLVEDYLDYKGLSGELILGLRACDLCKKDTPCGMCRTNELFFELEDVMDEHIDKYYSDQEKRDYFLNNNNRANDMTRNYPEVKDIFNKFDLIKDQIEEIINNNSEGSFIIYPDGSYQKMGTPVINPENKRVNKNNRLIKKLNELYLTDEFEYKGIKIKVKRIGNSIFKFEHDPIDNCTEEEIGEAYLEWLKNN